MDEDMIGVFVSPENLMKLTDTMNSLNSIVDTASNTKNSKEFRNLVIKVGFTCGIMTETINSIVDSPSMESTDNNRSIGFQRKDQ